MQFEYNNQSFKLTLSSLEEKHVTTHSSRLRKTENFSTVIFPTSFY